MGGNRRFIRIGDFRGASAECVAAMSTLCARAKGRRLLLFRLSGYLGRTCRDWVWTSSTRDLSALSTHPSREQPLLYKNFISPASTSNFDIDIGIFLSGQRGVQMILYLFFYGLTVQYTPLILLTLLSPWQTSLLSCTTGHQPSCLGKLRIQKKTERESGGDVYFITQGVLGTSWSLYFFDTVAQPNDTLCHEE